MSNNNTPTAPGWWWVLIDFPWKVGPEVVRLRDDGRVELLGNTSTMPSDSEYITWLCPVPMPGEFLTMCNRCGGEGWTDVVGPGNSHDTPNCHSCNGFGFVDPEVTR